MSLDDVADYGNLVRAFHRAAAGKRTRADVQQFSATVDEQLAALAREIRNDSVRVGEVRRFVIHDPKRRIIHAPVFRERVLHHAVMAHVGPVLDRALVNDTYACREGRGVLVAVRRVQEHLRRHDWYVQVDVRRFFDSIDHEVLAGVLHRRFKDRGLLALLRRIVGAYATEPGRGLPIGALTSQHFANAYLGSVDRYLLEELGVRGFVRYMDDVVWWVRDRVEARRTLREAVAFARARLRLDLDHRVRIQRSRCGVSFCGFRVHRGALRLSRRRMRRYRTGRVRWESAWRAGALGGQTCQSGYAAVAATTAHADARAWRNAEHDRRPPPDV